MKSLSRERKDDHNSSRLRGASGVDFGSMSSDGTGGTLSEEVLGVERLSSEALGRLLAEELEELKVVKFMRTLCGLRFIF